MMAATAFRVNENQEVGRSLELGSSCLKTVHSASLPVSDSILVSPQSLQSISIHLDIGVSRAHDGDTSSSRYHVSRCRS